MANTKTAYRWNANGWYFKAIEVEEDPDFPGEYTLPRQSTWAVPLDDTETQWAKINTATLTWELADLSMADRLEAGLITQEEYDTWFSQNGGEFLSVLKARAENNAANIALISDVESEAKNRADADVQINASIAGALENIKNLSDSLAANGNADVENKTALEQAIAALQQTTQALQLAINNKADANHGHSVVESANRLATPRKIGEVAFDGSGDISLSQMGVEALVASATANAGSGISVERDGINTIIRDTKNKVGFLLVCFVGSNTSMYSVHAPSDFKDILGVLGTADSGSARVSVDWDSRSVWMYSSGNSNVATVFIAAALE